MDEHKDENRGYVIAPIRANVQYPKDAKELAHSVARWGNAVRKRTRATRSLSITVSVTCVQD